MLAERIAVTGVTTRRYVYRLGKPVAYTTLSEPKVLVETEYVAVSHGRDGDTLLFPCDAEGNALDFYGYATCDYWHPDPDGFLAEWLLSGENRYVSNDGVAR